MPSTPLVSVCIPSYNHARFLPATLDGIFAQTFRDFEVVAVDDGSTDNSLEILNAYARRYPGMMRVFTHDGGKNLGPSATENRGIQEARGVYWCGNDSDDISYPDRLKRQVEFMESHPEIQWLYGVSDFIDKDGRKLPGIYGKDLSEPPGIVERLIMNCYIYPVMIRKSCLLAAGPFEPGLIFGDWEYVIRLAVRYPAAFLPGAVGAYRFHDSNTCSYPDDEHAAERALQALRWSLEVITTLRRKAENPRSDLSTPRLKALLDFRQASFHLLLKEKKSASAAARAAFQDDPSLRGDFDLLARSLTCFNSLRMAAMIVGNYGYPPRWLLKRQFLVALPRVVARRILYQFKAPPE